jgi:hypothetical protein
MDTSIFIIILLAVLIIVNYSFVITEGFDLCQRYDKCSKYDKSTYSKCYESGECSVMIDLLGNTFCTTRYS